MCLAWKSVPLLNISFQFPNLSCPQNLEGEINQNLLLYCNAEGFTAGKTLCLTMGNHCGYELQATLLLPSGHLEAALSILLKKQGLMG